MSRTRRLCYHDAMIATLLTAGNPPRDVEADAATGGSARRFAQPLLMGDILVAQGGVPEFVRRWNEDRDRTSGDPR